MPAELDNPFWNSLRTRHRGIALAGSGWLRYPPAYAPFLGVEHADVDVGQAIAPGESAYLLGIAPQAPAGWTLEAFRPLAQMIRQARIDVPEGPPILPLGQADRSEVLALTALVYPHYFRASTMDMGRYYGIRNQGRLAAIIGERLGTDSTQEMSAICTHPDFLGRGYARRLTAWLTNQALAEGRLPFLHVSHENPRARALYELLGYRTRIDIPFFALRRPAL